MSESRPPRTREWLPDEINVQALTQRIGVKEFNYRWVSIHEINIPKSARSNCRQNGFNHEDEAKRYAEEMEKGVKFPAPILMPGGADLYEILGGNHRIRGAELLGDQYVWAVIIPTLADDQQLCARLVFNVTNGQRESRDAVMQAATALVLEHKWPIKEVAERFRIPSRTIDSQVRHIKLLRDMQAKGINLRKANRDSVLPLNKLKTIPTIQMDLAQVIEATPDLPPDRVQIIVKKVLDATEEERPDIIKQFKQEQVTAAKESMKVRSSPGRKFLCYFRQLHNFSMGMECLSCLTPEDRQAVSDLWPDLMRRLTQLLSGVSVSR